MTRIICIGGAHLDQIGRTHGKAKLHTSNPGTMTVHAGGVARNVASLLVRSGHAIGLLSVIGDDQDGQTLLSRCRSDGLSTELLHQVPGRETARYLAIEDEAGDLVTAIAAMDIYSALSADLISTHADIIQQASLVFADTNCSADALDWLASLAPRPFLAVDAVSIAKARRLENSLTAFDLVFCNRSEALSLLSCDATSTEELASQIQAIGCKRALITDGPNPIACLEGDTIEMIPVTAIAQVSATGAGDALIAGVLSGHVNGQSLANSVRSALSTARLALQQLGSLTTDHISS
ncbi:carbohydrate kinase family protein [Coralliovum pocilloporae]|uniref:carbohydrate kinase family protein n=1 Tax=Coralliovum pocilloporae TaxID=3066369 RepID=UPI003306EB43